MGRVRGKKEKEGGQRENTGGETLGVRGNDGVRKAPGMAHKSPIVGDEEGGREASGVAENHRGRSRSGQGSQVATGRRDPRSGRGDLGG